MKTRTLLLLALGCGVAILLAGGVLLFQLAGQDAADPPVSVGTPVEVGDMVVTVVSTSESGGRRLVEVEIGGVDDADGADGFRMIASGRPAVLVADDAVEPAACGATTVAPQACSLVFDVATADGSSRVLFYDRGDDQARWELSRP